MQSYKKNPCSWYFVQSNFIELQSIGVHSYDIDIQISSNQAQRNFTGLGYWFMLVFLSMAEDTHTSECNSFPRGSLRRQIWGVLIAYIKPSYHRFTPHRETKLWRHVNADRSAAAAISPPPRRGIWGHRTPGSRGRIYGPQESVDHLRCNNDLTKDV